MLLVVQAHLYPATLLLHFTEISVVQEVIPYLVVVVLEALMVVERELRHLRDMEEVEEVAEVMAVLVWWVHVEGLAVVIAKKLSHHYLQHILIQ
jgi:hypothetical protein